MIDNQDAILRTFSMTHGIFRSNCEFFGENETSQDKVQPEKCLLWPKRLIAIQSILIFVEKS
jgi:hypothetical protein